MATKVQKKYQKGTGAGIYLIVLLAAVSAAFFAAVAGLATAILTLFL